MPSPSVSVGVHGAVPVQPASSTLSKIPSPSLSVSKKSGVPSPSVSTGVAPEPFSIASGIPSASLSASK